MHKNCFDGYLTDECSTCEFWHDGKTEPVWGCGVPFPIMDCDAYRDMMQKKEAKNNE